MPMTVSIRRSLIKTISMTSPVVLCGTLYRSAEVKTSLVSKILETAVDRYVEVVTA